MNQATTLPEPVELTDFQRQFQIYVRAGYPILYLVTAEEDRAIELICGALAAGGELAKRKPLIWSVSRGLCSADHKVINAKLQDPSHLLPGILDYQEPAVFILEDFHSFIDERSQGATLFMRQLRDLVTPFKAARKTVVLLSSVMKIPPELEKDVTVMDLAMPDEAELAVILDETVNDVKDNPKVEINLADGGREAIVKSLLGLTRSEAENALAKIIVTNSRIDPADIPLLLAEKEQIIRKSGVLEFYSTPERFGSIGGMDELKKWLRQRAKAFTESAQAFGLPYPRGCCWWGSPAAARVCRPKRSPRNGTCRC